MTTTTINADAAAVAAANPEVLAVLMALLTDEQKAAMAKANGQVADKKSFNAVLDRVNSVPENLIVTDDEGNVVVDDKGAPVYVPNPKFDSERVAVAQQLKDALDAVEIAIIAARQYVSNPNGWSGFSLSNGPKGAGVPLTSGRSIKVIISGEE